MGIVKLELRCPKTSPIVASPDPEPSWTLDDLFAEISSLESQIAGRESATPSPLKRENWDGGDRKPFVMSVDDFDVEDSDDEEFDSEKEGGARFSCDDVAFSDSEESEDGLGIEENRLCLLEKMNLEESVFFEIEAENQMKLKEEVRNKFSELEAARKNETERSASAAAHIEKLIEMRQEMDKRLDKQYQRKMAEVLDTHLSAVQRDHEQKSQIEERRLRDDAEEEKRKAILREKQLQEKAKEAEARIKAAKLAEEAQKAALEASQKALRKAKEEADKEMERTKDSTSDAVKDDSQQQKSSGSKDENALLKLSEDACITGVKVLAANAALEDEARRLKIYNEVSEKTDLVPEKELNKFERQINKVLRQISGTIENVSAKTMELIKLINHPAYPHSTSKKLFAKKVIALGEDPTGSFNHFAFACGRVILLVNSKVPDMMDLVLAEFNKACIYTVPKHLQTLKQTMQSKDYCKMLGYREEDGNLESTESYLKRVQTYVKLYAAIVQTEIDGVKNPYGLNKGWSWLARFLNTLPATRPTAYALEAFLVMAGYAMHRRYKSQFKKILNTISQSFLPALKERSDQNMNEIIVKLENYLNGRVFLEEPAGWRLQSGLSSHHFD